MIRIRAVLSFVSLLRDKGLRAAMRAATDRLHVRWFEWRLGIWSEAVIDLHELGIENELCRGYAPTDYRSFPKVLASLGIRPREDVFLDLGSGLGRAVILAARHSFRRVIGVEIAPRLNDIARRNVTHAASRLKCRNVELVTADATRYAIPDDVTVVYFFNPFAGSVLAQVLGNIRESWLRRRRDLRLICKLPAHSGFEDEILKHTWLVKEREIVFGKDNRYLVLIAATLSPPVH